MTGLDRVRGLRGHWTLPAQPAGGQVVIGLQDGRRHEPAPLATALGVGRAPVARFQASFRKATRVPAPAARNWGGRRRALLTPNEEKPFLAPLVALSGGKKVSVRLAERLAIVLLAAQGEENIALAAGWKITRQKAARWRDRSAPQGSKGIDMDAPRSGRIPRISSANKKRGVQRTLQEKPAAASGLRDSTIGRIWKGHGLKPH